MCLSKVLLLNRFGGGLQPLSILINDPYGQGRYDFKDYNNTLISKIVPNEINYFDVELNTTYIISGGTAPIEIINTRVNIPEIGMLTLHVTSFKDLTWEYPGINNRIEITIIGNKPKIILDINID